MNKYAFLRYSVSKCTEIFEGFGRVAASDAESFSVAIRAMDGSTLLETQAEYWSVRMLRIKASRDLGWIAGDET
jgi:hypothetical protein